MKACVDVDYRASEAVAACVLFREWTDAAPAGELVERLPRAAPYEPGRFFARELPCLLAVLARAPEPLEVVLVDGYAWLDREKPGLGAHLHRALGEKVPVVGIGKTHFAGSDAVARAVLRGTSRKALYVSAAGLDLDLAAEHVRAMHGEHRLPLLVKRADRLARDS